MKTKIISKLKKEILIIELPEEKTISTLIDLEITYDYTLLGSPDEIKEEDVIELVQMDNWTFGRPYYRNYKNTDRDFPTATESLISALESEMETFDRNRTLIFVKN